MSDDLARLTRDAQNALQALKPALASHQQGYRSIIATETLCPNVKLHERDFQRLTNDASKVMDHAQALSAEILALHRLLNDLSNDCALAIQALSRKLP